LKIKREFVSIRWSDVPPEQWIRIVLVEPKNFIPITIPNRGNYVAYKAYFPFTDDKRWFNIVFPLTVWQRALNAVLPELRQDLTKSIEFEFKKTRRSMHIQNWRQL